MAKPKHFRNNKALADAFVRATHPAGLGHSCSFVGKEFYSYQTLVAKFVNTTLLQTSIRYSTTTGRHLYYINKLWRGNTIYVPNVHANDQPSHELNLQHLWSEYDKRYKKLLRVAHDKDNTGSPILDGELSQRSFAIKQYIALFQLPVEGVELKFESAVFTLQKIFERTQAWRESDKGQRWFAARDAEAARLARLVAVLDHREFESMLAGDSDRILRLLNDQKANKKKIPLKFIEAAARKIVLSSPPSSGTI